MSSGLAEIAKQLLHEQIQEWALPQKHYSGLKDVVVKEFSIGGVPIKVQFNPGRMISTSAKVDTKSISERKCFLCLANLPAEQRGIDYANEYTVLVNPFPIFPEHFTIPHKEHVPQRISDHLPSLFTLAADLGDDFTVFYNGPKCGASAPDHFHFQAGTRGFMTIEDDFKNRRDTISRYLLRGLVSVSAVDDGIRKYLVLESKDKIELQRIFLEVFNVYSQQFPDEVESLLNVLVLFEEKDKLWRIFILLRAKHRPARYFAEDESRITLSPAAVDLGGVCIIPVKEDFEKVNEEILKEIFAEVFISEQAFNDYIATLESSL